MGVGSNPTSDKVFLESFPKDRLPQIYNGAWLPRNKLQLAIMQEKFNANGYGSSTFSSERGH